MKLKIHYYTDKGVVVDYNINDYDSPEELAKDVSWYIEAHKDYPTKLIYCQKYNSTLLDKVMIKDIINFSVEVQHD